MILADTSVWIDHMRGRQSRFAAALEGELAFIERRSLMGKGLGYIDVHLLASTALSRSARLWTHDRRLAAMAATLNLAHDQSL